VILGIDRATQRFVNVGVVDRERCSGETDAFDLSAQATPQRFRPFVQREPDARRAGVDGE